MKKTIIVFLFVALSVNLFGAGVVCDFDGNSKSDNSDLFILLAYIQVRGLADIGIQTLDIATVQATARALTNNSGLVLQRLPGAVDILEDTSGSALTNNDLMILLSYLQTKGLADLGILTLDFPTVRASAIQNP